MSDKWRLLADVGGTNIRFGLAREGQPGKACDIVRIRSWPSDIFDDFEAALRAYLATLDVGLQFSSVAIAAAGPSTPGAISLTNRNWVITVDGLHDTVNCDAPTRLLNDLEAVAYALPYLPESAVNWWDDIRPPSLASGRQLAVNVGTGFGSATIINADGNWICCPAESGHMHLGILDARELDLLSRLGPGDATVEGILSGEGVRRLWRAVIAESRLAGSGQSRKDCSFDFARTDPATNETREIFSAFLARSAANLVLASASWDGVYLMGSVALAWSRHANGGSFRRMFAGNSKMRERLAATPIGLIRHEFPAFLGLANVRIL